MDNTASLRAIAPAIEAERRGETLLAARKAGDAEREFALALKRAPSDYTGLITPRPSRLSIAPSRFTRRRARRSS